MGLTRGNLSSDEDIVVRRLELVKVKGSAGDESALRREVAAASAGGQFRPRHGHSQLAKAAIVLIVGRVVGECVLIAELVNNVGERLVELVSIL